MDRTCCLLLFVLAFTSLAYGRSNICLAAGATIYKPLQLYPSDCPHNASNCMAAVYNYNASTFSSQGPASLRPGARQSYVYMTQDASDNLDVVIESVTTYTNTIINAQVQVIGAVPYNAEIIVKDDPTQDQWQWNPNNNTGAFEWFLQPGYTDGVVLGHFQLIENYCFRVTFLPNWGGSIATIIFLSGNVSKPVVVASKPLVGNSTYSTYFEFCEYPQAVITATNATCFASGTATAAALNNTANATYLWTDSTGATVGTTKTVSGLTAGTYTVLLTEGTCSITRDVTIGYSALSFTASTSTTTQTRQTLGTVTVSVSGGYPPYAITWLNAAGVIIASNVTTLQVPEGSYSVTVSDGCHQMTYPAVVDGPASCPPGTIIDPSSQGCLSCRAGTFTSAQDSSACTVCPPGSWNDVVNSTSCNECPANTYSSGGTDSCSNC